MLDFRALLSDVISRSYSVFVIRPMYSGINLPIPKRTAAVQLNANQFLLTDSQIEGVNNSFCYKILIEAYGVV